MARVKVSRDVTIRASDVVNVQYPTGYEGRATRAHAERIAAAGAGEWLDKDSPASPEDATANQAAADQASLDPAEPASAP